MIPYLQISVSEVFYWNRDPKELQLEQENKMYPPRITMTARVVDARNQIPSKITVKLGGLVKSHSNLSDDFEYEFIPSSGWYK